MSFRNSVRVFTVVAALAATATLPARALPQAEGARFSAEQGAFSLFIEGIQSLWRGIWGEEGMLIDPHGGTGTNSGDPVPPPATDEGMLIDPHG